MWKKCPICNGTGKDPQCLDKHCTVCNGYKIISELTGLPPVTKDSLKKIDPIELKNLKNP